MRDQKSLLIKTIKMIDAVLLGRTWNVATEEICPFSISISNLSFRFVGRVRRMGSS